MDNVRHLTARDAGPGGLERVPPQNDEAEQAVLGGMILSSDQITPVSAAMDPADHYRPAHETIHRTILNLHAAGEPIDSITVVRALSKSGVLQRVGGAPYITTLVQSVPVASNAEWYAEIVHDLARRRRLIEAATRILNSGYNDNGDIDTLLDAARKEFDTAVDGGARGPAHLADSILQWDDFFATDFGAIELLPGRLLAPGQQIAIVGDGKAGKSLFTLEWLWRMATGRPFLGDRAHAPVPVLYVDAENGREEIQKRLVSYGAGPADMGLLTYASFPPVRPLDTPGGGADLVAMVTASGAQVVALDTVSRFISGEENSADTWLALYRCTLLPLKRAGIASVRLDHFGKDRERGARGNSAKTQDVDHVWELSAQGGSILALKRTHSRTGVGPGHFGIARQARQEYGRWLPGETRHILAVDAPMDATGSPQEATGLAAIPGTAEHIVATLDKAGVPLDWGAPRVRTRLAEMGVRVGKTRLEEALRIRKSRPVQTGRGDVISGPQMWAQQAYPDQGGQGRVQDDPKCLPPGPPPDLPPSTFNQPPPDLGGGEHKTPGQTSPGEVRGTSPQRSPDAPSPRPPSQEGGGGGDPGEPDAGVVQICLICRQPLDPDRAAAGYDTHHPCPTTTEGDR